MKVNVAHGAFAYRWRDITDTPCPTIVAKSGMQHWIILAVKEDRCAS